MPQHCQCCGGITPIQGDLFSLKVGFPLRVCSYGLPPATISFPGLLVSGQKWLCPLCQPAPVLHSLASPAWPKLLQFMQGAGCDNFLVISQSQIERRVLLTMVSGHQPLECSTFSISSLQVTEHKLSHWGLLEAQTLSCCSVLLIPNNPTSVTSPKHFI